MRLPGGLAEVLPSLELPRSGVGATCRVASSRTTVARATEVRKRTNVDLAPREPEPAPLAGLGSLGMKS